MLVSALMCVRRKRPLSDAGGAQLSKLVASMGEHLSSARENRGRGLRKPPRAVVPTPPDKWEARASMEEEFSGDAPRALTFPPSSADL